MIFRTIIKPPYNLLICAAIFIAAASLFKVNDTIDFHWPDTYFVISSPYVLWAIAFTLICVWGLYRTVSKILLSSVLTWVHSIATVFVLIAFSTSGLWYKAYNPPTRRYYSDDSFRSLIHEYGIVFVIFLVIIIIFLVGQLAFVINVIGGLIRYLFILFKKRNAALKINKN